MQKALRSEILREYAQEDGWRIPTDHRPPTTDYQPLTPNH